MRRKSCSAQNKKKKKSYCAARASVNRGRQAKAMHKLFCFGEFPVADVIWRHRYPQFRSQRYWGPIPGTCIIKILPQYMRALFHHALMSQNGARGSVCISSFTSSVDADLQSFFKEYFVDTDSDDDDVEFEGSTPGDIRGRPVYLIKSCRDRQISESDSHRDIMLPSSTSVFRLG